MLSFGSRVSISSTWSAPSVVVCALERHSPSFRISSQSSAHCNIASTFTFVRPKAFTYNNSKFPLDIFIGFQAVQTCYLEIHIYGLKPFNLFIYKRTAIECNGVENGDVTKNAFPLKACSQYL